jgi:hypothetical protein
LRDSVATGEVRAVLQTVLVMALGAFQGHSRSLELGGTLRVHTYTQNTSGGKALPCFIVVRQEGRKPLVDHKVLRQSLVLLH